ncbi:MAG: hypothetical protein ACWGSQ_07975, partial [Longimicrobiales bacterium]
MTALVGSAFPKRRARGVLLLLPGFLLSVAPSPGATQEPDLQRQIQESQRRLEAIREERARLQAEME